MTSVVARLAMEAGVVPARIRRGVDFVDAMLPYLAHPTLSLTAHPARAAVLRWSIKIRTLVLW